MYQNYQWWKIALFVFAILLVAGAVTYTLMTRLPSNTVTGNAPAAPASASNTSPVDAAAAPAAPSSTGTGELNWIAKLDAKLADNDFVFVVLPGSNDVMEKVNQAVKSASEKIRQDGTSIEAMALSSTDPEFQSTLDRLAIQKLPAVLVYSPSGQNAVVKGDITETKLLQAYLSLCACAPSNSGCCPK